jgi:hypothetical protein
LEKNTSSFENLKTRKYGKIGGKEYLEKNIRKEKKNL